MLAAMVVHVSRPGELPGVVINLVLLTLAAVVAIGRVWIAPTSG